MKKLLSTAKNGFIDPISLITLGLLIVGLAVTTAIVKNPNTNLDVRNWAKEISGTGGGGGSKTKPSPTLKPIVNKPSPFSSPSPSPVVIAQADSCDQGTVIDCSALGKRCIPDVNGGHCESAPAPVCTPQLISTASSCQGNQRQQRWREKDCSIAVRYVVDPACSHSSSQIQPSPSPSPATIAQSDCDKCRLQNTYAECKTVCENIGETIITPAGQPQCSSVKDKPYCSGNTLKTCSASGIWGTRYCSNGCDSATASCKTAPTPTPSPASTQRCNNMGTSVEKLVNGQWQESELCQTYCNTKTNSCQGGTPSYAPGNTLPPQLAAINPSNDPLSLTQDPGMSAILNQSVQDCIKKGFTQNQCSQAFQKAADTKDTCIAVYLLENPNRSLESAQEQCTSDRTSALLVASSYIPGLNIIPQAVSSATYAKNAVDACGYYNKIKDNPEVDPKDKKATLSSCLINSSGAVTNFFGTLGSAANSALPADTSIGTQFATSAFNTIDAAGGTIIGGINSKQLCAQYGTGSSECQTALLQTVISTGALALNLPNTISTGKSWTNSQLSNNTNTIALLEKSSKYYDYSGKDALEQYIENYGEIPSTMKIGANPNEIYSFQKALIQAAQGNGEFDIQALENLLSSKGISMKINIVNERQLRAAWLAYKEGMPPNKIASYVDNLTQTNNLPRPSSEDCPAGFCLSYQRKAGFLGMKTEMASEVFIGNSRSNQYFYGVPSDEAEIMMLQKIGHEVGHAADHYILGITNPWATEIRQKAFNAQFYRAIGAKDTGAGYQEFVNSALDQTIATATKNLRIDQSIVNKLLTEKAKQTVKILPQQPSISAKTWEQLYKKIGKTQTIEGIDNKYKDHISIFPSSNVIKLLEGVRNGRTSLDWFNATFPQLKDTVTKLLLK